MPTTLEPNPTEIASDALPVPKGAKRMTRRKFLRRLIAAGAAVGAGSIYATQVEPFWVQYHELDVPIANLPTSFDGFRIAQLTDLHAGDSVPIDFLSRVIDRVNQLNPDCIVVTGDLVTHDPKAVEPVCQLLARLRSPVYVTFGNHDYCPWNAMPGPVRIISDALESKLKPAGCVVMRNQPSALHRGKDRIWLVGLEDLYTNRFFPAVAFAGVPDDEPKICLSHNPDSVDDLLPYKPDLILSGHTHGGQIRLPLWGAIKLPTSNKHLDQGWFQLPHGRLYVSRGVGFLARVRFDCRPEIPVFRLTRQT